MCTHDVPTASNLTQTAAALLGARPFVALGALGPGAKMPSRGSSRDKPEFLPVDSRAWG